jgi:hypothetical protein
MVMDLDVECVIGMLRPLIRDFCKRSGKRMGRRLPRLFLACPLMSTFCAI